MRAVLSRVLYAAASRLAPPPQTITIQVQHLDADGMAAIADSRIELAFDRYRDL